MQLANMIPEQKTNHLELMATEILQKQHILHPHEIDLELIISHYPSIRFLYMDQKSKSLVRTEDALLFIDKRLDHKNQR